MTQPNFSGLWQLNLEKSRIPGLAVRAIGMKIEHAEPDFVQAVKALHESGEVSLGRLAGNTSGTLFINKVRNLDMVSTATWVGEELVIDSHVDTGGSRPMHFRDYWSLSDDGNKLRMEHRDDDIAGQLSVLERAGDGA